jgi:hypothetical protein
VQCLIQLIQKIILFGLSKKIIAKKTFSTLLSVHLFALSYIPSRVSAGLRPYGSLVILLPVRTYYLVR